MAAPVSAGPEVASASRGRTRGAQGPGAWGGPSRFRDPDSRHAHVVWPVGPQPARLQHANDTIRVVACCGEKRACRRRDRALCACARVCARVCMCVRASCPACLLLCGVSWPRAHALPHQRHLPVPVPAGTAWGCVERGWSGDMCARGRTEPTLRLLLLMDGNVDLDCVLGGQVVIVQSTGSGGTGLGPKPVTRLVSCPPGRGRGPDGAAWGPFPGSTNRPAHGVFSSRVDAPSSVTSRRNPRPVRQPHGLRASSSAGTAAHAGRTSPGSHPGSPRGSSKPPRSPWCGRSSPPIHDSFCTWPGLSPGKPLLPIPETRGGVPRSAEPTGRGVCGCLLRRQPWPWGQNPEKAEQML